MALWKPAAFSSLVSATTASMWDDDDDDGFGSHSEHVINRQIKGNITTTGALSDHSLQAPYTDNRFHSEKYIYGGSAIIDLNRHIRLTRASPGQSGYVWSRRPIPTTHFQLDVEISIGEGNPSFHGDGLAIWLVDDVGGRTGPVFGAPDHWKGLGIFIDTFPNTRHETSFPMIFGMINDGSKTYDVGRDGQGQTDGECEVPHIREEGSHTIRINYVQSKFVEVLVQHDREMFDDDEDWQHCFTIWNPSVPLRPYVGVSAHTGDLVDNHDIIGIDANRIVYNEDASPMEAPIPVVNSKSNTSWMSYLVMVGLVIVIFASVRRYRRVALKKF